MKLIANKKGGLDIYLTVHVKVVQALGVVNAMYL